MYETRKDSNMNDLSHHDHEGHEHHHDHGSGHGAHHGDGGGEKPFTDPVCGMKVGADPAKEIRYEEATYHFCSTKCMDKFRTAPQQYTGGAKPEPVTASA